MNIQQLEYIVAIDDHRHFVTAANKCFITQPTLSMMVQKLEEELNAKIFNRSVHPIAPTPMGEKIINQARKVLFEAKKLKHLAIHDTLTPFGEIKLGVIPTIAPYLIPNFIKNFLLQFPEVKLSIFELKSAEIIEKLNKGELDAGILATPLKEKNLFEKPLYQEKFILYVSQKDPKSSKKYATMHDIDMSRLWLLEDGNCFRNQVLKLCDLKKHKLNAHVNYDAGSIQTMIRMVDIEGGVTILPEMSRSEMTPKQRKQIKSFTSPEPMREVSVVLNKLYYNESIVLSVEKIVKKSIQLLGVSKSQGKPIHPF